MIETREQLAQTFKGVGVELGVARGTFSAEILSNPNVTRLYSIDRWAGDRAHGDRECEKATRLLAQFGARSRIIRRTFNGARLLFHDGIGLDFCYVDGYAHTGQEDGKTLDDWLPLVRSGGIFAGHDYCVEYLATKVAVDDMVKRYRLALQTTNEPLASWYVVAP